MREFILVSCGAGPQACPGIKLRQVLSLVSQSPFGRVFCYVTETDSVSSTPRNDRGLHGAHATLGVSRMRHCLGGVFEPQVAVIHVKFATCDEACPENAGVRWTTGFGSHLTQCM